MCVVRAVCRVSLEVDTLPVQKIPAHAGGGHHPQHSHLLHLLVGFGGAGLFVVSAIDASIIPLPIPGSTDLLLLYLVSRRANAWVMALAATAGSLLGGYLSWKAGEKGGEAAIDHHAPKRFSTQLKTWVRAHGTLAVGLAALLPPPLPLFPFLLSAGALGVSRKKFFVSFGIGKALRYSLLAWLGIEYGRKIVRAWSQYLSHWSATIGWGLAAIFAAAVLFGVWRYRRSERRRGGSAAKSSLARS